MTRLATYARRLAACVVLVSTASCSSLGGREASPPGEANVDLTAPSGPATAEYRPVGAEENNAWVNKMVDCLKREGFNAVSFESSPGLLGFQQDGQAQEQASAWSDGIARCQGIVGAPPELPRFTEAQLSKLYDFYLRQRDCLQGEGYHISEPPTRETFVANYYAQDPWGPYADIGRISPTELQALERICPELPTAEDLR